MKDQNIVLFDTSIGELEMQAVQEVLTSGWLSMGAVTESFEHEFAAAHGVDEAVAVSSGTAALHLAILALGVGPGDEVIMPSLNFVAAAEVVALIGARPVFADITSAYDLTVAHDDVARCITPQTKAIVAMHYGGYAADLAPLKELARRHDITLIEDAAHAPAVRASDGMLGTIGDVGCFSFFATKNVTTGEGGMVLARDPDVLSRVRSMRSHCMTTSSWERHRGRASTYDVTGLGLNYRPTEIGSAIGRAQLGRVREDRLRRRSLVEEYRERLDGIPELILPFSDRCDEDSANHLFPVVLPASLPRGDVQVRLRSAGIQSSVHYPPIHEFSYYRERFSVQPGSLGVTDYVASHELTLPLHARLTREQVRLVTETFRAAL